MARRFVVPRLRRAPEIAAGDGASVGTPIAPPTGTDDLRSALPESAMTLYADRSDRDSTNRLKPYTRASPSMSSASASNDVE